MATTKISDIIEPEVFAAYVREAVIEKSALIRSGIVTQSEQFNSLVSGGGRTLNLPFWRRIGGDSEILSDQRSLTPDKIGTAAQIATLHLRGKAWGANELASAIAGSSAVDAIASMIAEWWDRQEQKILIATLTGAFAAASMSNHVWDKSAEAISKTMTLDAKQLLGDASDQLAAMFMHSAVYTDLQKQDLIDYVVPSDGGKPIPFYQGYSTVIDDTMPSTGTGADRVFDTYLMASGVIGRGDGTPVDLTPVETDRDSLAGEDYLINRRAFTLHPQGLAWIGNPADTTASNTELTTGTNWERVADDKHIGMVVMRHKISA